MSNRFVQLTAINGKREAVWLSSLARSQQPPEFREVEFNEDDLERPINDDEGDDAPEAAAPAAITVDMSNPPAGIFSPIAVAENDIREMYPRRGDVAGVPRVGTRIVYRSGQPRLVKETFEEVTAMFAALYPVVSAPAPRSRSRATPPTSTQGVS